jgi:hypothetical protein
MPIVIIFIQGKIRLKLDRNKFLDFFIQIEKQTLIYGEKLTKPTKKSKYRG